MTHFIYSLSPKSYVKKSSKSSVEYPEVDSFLIELRRRIVECWKYDFEVDTTNGSGYKIKFDQFEKKFLKKSDLVFYIVSLKSEEMFKCCIEKLIKSSKNSNKLNKIVVLSLDAQNFEELNCSPIEFVYFGNDWQSENASQWSVLENTLKSKIEIHSSNEEVRETNTLPIPISNTGRRSPSRIKTFFNSLPTKFELDKRKSLFSPSSPKELVEYTASSGLDIRVPNINISNEGDTKPDDSNHNLVIRHKTDSAKLSLNSLFKRHSKKSRNSAMSVDSSTSTGSGSRQSDVLQNNGGTSTDNALSSKENSPKIQIASVHKPERHKAKIEVFKAKANKVIRSTNCLQSPGQKRSKCHVKDMMGNVVSFSTTLMTVSTDVGSHSENNIDRRKQLASLLNGRGQSEPPGDAVNDMKIESNSDKHIKYYSWHEDINEDKEFIVSELICDDLEKFNPILEPTFDKRIMEFNQLTGELDSVNGMIDGDYENNRDMLVGDFRMEEDDSDIFYTTFTPSTNTSEYTDNQNNINGGQTDVSYSTFLPSKNSEVKISTRIKKTKVPKDDQMESLDILIKSIQLSCEEMRAERKSQENSDEGSDVNNVGDVEEEIKGKNVQQELGEFLLIDEENSKESKTMESNTQKTKSNTLHRLNCQIVSSDQYREMSPELIAVADNITKTFNAPFKYFQRTYRSMIRNPYVVTGVFAATAYTAPVWCNYVPINMHLPNMLYGTLDYLMYSQIVQSIPNQIISTGRSGATVATNTIKRFLILLPSVPWLNVYKLTPA